MKADRGETDGGEEALRILVADDEAATREMLKQFLEAKGYEVTAVEDGRAAMEAADRQRFSAVILDIHMPRMGGLDALKAIRERNKRVPIVMLTALTDRSLAEMAIGMGANDFLNKPFDLEALEKNLMVKILMDNLS